MNLLKKKMIIFNILFWIILSGAIFYWGSVNVGIWGRWQGFEIVMPLIIAMFLSGVVTGIIILLEYLIGLYD